MILSLRILFLFHYAYQLSKSFIVIGSSCCNNEKGHLAFHGTGRIDNFGEILATSPP